MARDKEKHAQRKREWTQRNPGKKQLSNKLHWIKRQYGEVAKQYFRDVHSCEECGEGRLACLAIHHLEGKQVESFRVLCHNCHMVEHHGDYTYKQAALV